MPLVYIETHLWGCGVAAVLPRGGAAVPHVFSRDAPAWVVASLPLFCRQMKLVRRGGAANSIYVYEDVTRSLRC